MGKCPRRNQRGQLPPPGQEEQAGVSAVVSSPSEQSQLLVESTRSMGRASSASGASETDPTGAIPRVPCHYWRRRRNAMLVHATTQGCLVFDRLAKMA